jgi:hypothetical protein
VEVGPDGARGSSHFEGASLGGVLPHQNEVADKEQEGGQAVEWQHIRELHTTKALVFVWSASTQVDLPFAPTVVVTHGLAGVDHQSLDEHAARNEGVARRVTKLTGFGPKIGVSKVLSHQSSGTSCSRRGHACTWSEMESKKEKESSHGPAFATVLHVAELEPAVADKTDCTLYPGARMSGLILRLVKTKQSPLRTDLPS